MQPNSSANTKRQLSSFIYNTIWCDTWNSWPCMVLKQVNSWPEHLGLPNLFVWSFNCNIFMKIYEFMSLLYVPMYEWIWMVWVIFLSMSRSCRIYVSKESLWMSNVTIYCLNFNVVLTTNFIAIFLLSWNSGIQYVIIFKMNRSKLV